MATGPCARILTALQDCKRKHPRDLVRESVFAMERAPPPPRPRCLSHAPPPPLPPSLPLPTRPKTNKQFVCQHLAASAGWCMWSNLCPQEVRGIEDCLGVASSAGTAPRIPQRCAPQAARLEACIEAHQLLADERTDRCTGPQPIPPHSQSQPQPQSQPPAAGNKGR